VRHFRLAPAAERAPATGPAPVQIVRILHQSRDVEAAFAETVR